ncbi:hypothetical protein Stube_31950 [Streptomyces tubercidicus]|uniref:Uncharacterized protein n=1 Tax=Streptomyces tubercidicus TaxID=47759 RepID=A0A640USY9_9ACTN|nr:hypothetical protein Stube_31950 [Streptomyces tubercidicus]
MHEDPYRLANGVPADLELLGERMLGGDPGPHLPLPARQLGPQGVDDGVHQGLPSCCLQCHFHPVHVDCHVDRRAGCPVILQLIHSAYTELLPKTPPAGRG